ncbi:glycoside hydrolase family 3 N-terminal domain-containing protein [Agromyces indicus]|uniref:Glycoside hydrolase family 3 N-terminal domain-containing protein n=1 Tax=Agromyces indicus TaxID=758919 RepID=A0ABU1FLQ2_9MICO|nr:glycoside hydrolase family 3 N-terminal domain-containing protein [Agromyces indicus]MDR5692272.1 glycoside hydrolase family 3 N-terminal domain-containing protein [Agromyces indicus]
MRRSLPTTLAALALAGTAVLAGCSAPAPASPTPSEAITTPSPTPTPTPQTAEEWATDRVSGMTVDEKAASVLMLHAPGTDPAAMRALLDDGIAGVILMGDNMPGDEASLAALTADLQHDPDAATLIGIDQEGSIVSRIDWDPAPGPADVRAQPPQAAQEAFAARAAALSAAGVNVNFGIVADVTADPASFIFDRVLGTDPAGAGERVAAAVAGERGTVASTVKHFPGHGAAPGDSHVSVPSAPLTLEEWRAGPALPFAAAIEADVELVMTGHLAYPAVDPAPASLSPEWHRILREELGFDGVVVTDDMLMLQHNQLPEYADPGENAVRALAAGGDLLLYVLPADPAEFGISVDGLVASISEAVASGRIPEARLDEAATRVLELRRELVAESGE